MERKLYNLMFGKYPEDEEISVTISTPKHRVIVITGIDIIHGGYATKVIVNKIKPYILARYTTLEAAVRNHKTIVKELTKNLT